MKRIIFVLLSLISSYCAYSDVNTDKAIAQIGRDTTNYISVDVRASTEEAAFDEAKKKLAVQIADYIKTECPGEVNPDYSNSLSSYNQLISKISDNRYRVMLYVKKCDLLPEKIGKKFLKAPTDTVITLPSVPLNPILSQITKLRTAKELTECLQSLRIGNQINGAAAFPVAFANDFYIAVIDGKVFVTVLHFVNGQYIDIESGQTIDIKKYANCTGYWFTL